MSVDLTKLVRIKDLKELASRVKPNLSKPNLIRNWYFLGRGISDTFPINSRGETSYTGPGYCIDGWISPSTAEEEPDVNTTVSLNSDANHGLRIKRNTSSGRGVIRQYIDGGVTGLQGDKDYRRALNQLKTMTISMVVDTQSGGKLITATGEVKFVNNTSVTVPVLSASHDSHGCSIELYGIPSTNTAYVDILVSGSYSIRGVKLEFGDTQTLAYQKGGSGEWLIRDIPDRKYELFRCQTSTADPADTYANKRNLVEGMAKPNDNLLDNAYFVGGGSGYGVFPVNQRYPLASWTNITNIKGTIDRWGVGGNRSTIEALDNGISVSKGASSSKGEFVQIVDSDPNKFLSRTYTISLLYNDGGNDKLISVSGVIPSTVNVDANASWIDFGDRAGANIRIGWWTGHGVYVTLENYSDDVIVFKAAKLEVGTTQTLAHQENGMWVPNEIPRYGDELRKCQEYLWLESNVPSNAYVVANGVATSATTAIFTMFLPCNLAKSANPTAITNGLNVYSNINNASKSLTALSVASIVGNVVGLTATISSATAGESLRLVVLQGGKIGVSTEP